MYSHCIHCSAGLGSNESLEAFPVGRRTALGEIEQGGEDWWKDPALQIGNGPFQMTEYAEEQQKPDEAKRCPEPCKTCAVFNAHEKQHDQRRLHGRARLTVWKRSAQDGRPSFIFPSSLVARAKIVCYTPCGVSRWQSNSRITSWPSKRPARPPVWPD